MAPGAGHDPENVRAEYAAANDGYMHYDGFRWQAGSFLIGGVFIFWGLLVQQELPARVVVVASFLITGLMSVWLLFAHHYRQIYIGKLHRLWQLEDLLGADQHTRFRRGGPRPPFPIFGPRGHHLDIAVFVVSSIGSALLGAARNGWHWTFLLPLVLILATVAVVMNNERRHKSAVAAYLGPP